MSKKIFRIDQIIKSLTPEEIQEHKELILESISREIALDESSQVNKENIEKLSESFEKIFSGLQECNELSNKIRLIISEGKGGLN